MRLVYASLHLCILDSACGNFIKYEIAARTHTHPYIWPVHWNGKANADSHTHTSWSNIVIELLGADSFICWMEWRGKYHIKIVYDLVSPVDVDKFNSNRLSNGFSYSFASSVDVCSAIDSAAATPLQRHDDHRRLIHLTSVRILPESQLPKRRN